MCGFVRTARGCLALSLCFLLSSRASSSAACDFRDKGYVDGGPGKDGIPSIDSPHFESVSGVHFTPSTVVIGLVYNGSARAYPTFIMRWHEIVNDRVGDARVSVTYGVLAGAASAFVVTTDQQSLGVSGKLYENDLVMFARGSGDNFVQIAGRAVESCDDLPRVPTVVTRWGTWRSLHPDTVVMTTNTGFDREYSADPYPQYAFNDDIYFVTSYRRDAAPYNLYGTKSSVKILVRDSSRYMFHSSVMEQAGCFTFDQANGTSESVESAADVLASYSLDPALAPADLLAMERFFVVVGHDVDQAITRAWLVGLGGGYNGTFENPFSVVNSSVVFSLISTGVQGAERGPSGAGAVPAVGDTVWDFSMVQQSGQLQCGNQTVPYAAVEAPLVDAYWFAAIAIYPRANILTGTSQGGFKFVSYDPEIIYSYPWRPWMIASLVAASLIVAILLSCSGFCAFHAFHKKAYALSSRKATAVTGDTVIREELKLLVQEGLLTPEDVR